MKRQSPKKLSKELAAYLAGLMDGDGNISIARQRYGGKDKSPHYRLCAVINMTHRETVQWINLTIPGSLYSIQSKFDYRGSWNRKPIHRWSIWGQRAVWFISQIAPYMRVRKKQAQLAILFQSSIKSGRKTNEKGKGKFVCLAENELSKREKFYWQMRECNSGKIGGG